MEWFKAAQSRSRERLHAKYNRRMSCVCAFVRVCVCMLHAYVYVCMPMCSYVFMGIAHVYV